MKPELGVDSEVRIIRVKDVVKMTGLSRSTIYDRINSMSPRYDKDFPRPRKLGGNSVGWLSCEMQQWVSSREVVQRLKSCDRGGGGE